MRKHLTFCLFTLSCALVATWTALGKESGLATFTTFNVPGAGYTQARYINPRGEIVGFYFDGAPFASPGNGFLRSKDGALTTIDFPGATSTLTVARQRRRVHSL
jgi:hypothetical protein